MSLKSVGEVRSIPIDLLSYNVYYKNTTWIRSLHFCIWNLKSHYPNPPCNCNKIMKVTALSKGFKLCIILWIQYSSQTSMVHGIYNTNLDVIFKKLTIWESHSSWQYMIKIINLKLELVLENDFLVGNV